MRARVAYISSLGTTAILVAAALLMLAVVSAIVAFRGWPGNATGAPVQTVALAPRQSSQDVTVVRFSPSALGLERGSHAAARRAAARGGRLSTGASGPRVLPHPGMEPGAAPLMTSQPGSVGHVPQGPAEVAGTQRQEGGQPEGPVPGSGGVPLSLPASGAPSPPADQVTATVGGLVGGSPPPPTGR
jgi:hypothetical protein